MAPVRHVIVFACFLATFCAYVERVGFSIAYTRMAKDAQLDEAVKGRVLSTFYWGYALSQCIPPPERAIATSITTSGMYLGSAAAMWVLPSVVQMAGPGGLLKCVGCLGLSWMVLWYFVGRGLSSVDHELPVATHKSLSQTGSRSVPWNELLTSIPIWAIIVNNFTFHYAVYVVMNWLPTYFMEFLEADLSSIGAIKSIPYIVMFGFSIIGMHTQVVVVVLDMLGEVVSGGWLGDFFILRGKLSVASGRKIVNSLGFVTAAVALICMARAGSVWMGVICTTMVMGALGLSRGGFSVNHMDIAPTFAGIVMGISNTAGTLSGVIGVAVTGAILEGNGGSRYVEGWTQAFAVAALLCVVGNIFFLRSAKGERLFE